MRFTLCRSFGAASGVSACVLVASASSASAAVMTFSDRALFEAATLTLTGELRLETFESETVRMISSDDVMVESGLRIGVSDPGWRIDITDQEAFSYNTTPGGSKHVRFAFGNGDFSAMFFLPTVSNAFAFDITGFQDFDDDGGFTVDLLLGETIVDTIFLNDPGDFFASFHGMISDNAFDRVSVRIAGGDFVGFDEIAFMTVPGAGVLPMVLLAFASATCGFRRRRS